MISGAVSFEEIIESVKDETGITNLRPYYDKIRRLIFRAEREIGYGGSVVLFKKTYIKGVNGFDGKYVKYPDDMIELEGVGTAQDGPFRGTDYSPISEGVRFRSITQKVTMLYWGLLCDTNGNPVSTRNHEEAVVSYIVWKLYAPRRFIDKGNANTVEDLKRTFHSDLFEARGDDAFPTMEQWNEIGLLSYSDRRGLLQRPIASYDYSDELIPERCDPTAPESPVKVYFWQMEIGQDLLFLQAVLNQAYLISKPNLALNVFEIGNKVTYTTIGKIVFAISPVEYLSFTITDLLNNDITDGFDSYFDIPTKSRVFISKNNMSHSEIYFKFKRVL